MNIDYAIYAAHGVFWTLFGLARLALRGRAERSAATQAAPAAETAVAAPHAKMLVAFHGVAFAALYIGIGRVVMPDQVPAWFDGQRILGALVIVLGGLLGAWSLAHFASWRFEARLDTGHKLATTGPFALMRHPIYTALDLFALGTAIWIPTPIVWAGFALMAIGGDLRARAEERLLRQTFGQDYADYSAKTRRFVPGVY